jgi:Flp pilus assembly protein TadG
MLLRSFWKNEDGAYAILAGLMMPVLLSAAILATEVGMWAMRHQQMQGATEAAALAGVIRKATGGTS